MKHIRSITLAVLTVMALLSFSAGLVFAEEQKPAGIQAPAVAAPVQAVTAPAPKIDTGDTAWMIVATALVMLMTLPGLALFYGGMAKGKNVLNTLAMSLPHSL